MKKILTQLAVYILCGCHDKTDNIMDIIYGENKSQKQKPLVKTNSIKSVMSKKEELVDNLTYLKSKKTKTKQDKESIYTLEMVLKNMK
jgi:hypothetical protein